jgi:capsular exopolysaccharide synthesis family protein
MTQFQPRFEPEQTSKIDKADEFDNRLVTVLNRGSAAAEAYRTLRANLFYKPTDVPLNVIVLTSPDYREDASITCANLGVTLASISNTLIVDCDFRNPTLHRIFALQNLRGLTDILAEAYTIWEVCQEPVPGLKVLSTGPRPADSPEVLNMKRFADFLNQARLEFDHVLISAPPIEISSDSLILAHQSDGVVVILDAKRTRKGSIHQSMRMLEAIGANVLGTVVVNDGKAKSV